MGLRLKTALTITCFFIAVIAATHVLFTYVLLGEFDRLERERTDKNMTRVFESLDGVVEELSNRVSDWAHWDETYDYVRGANASFIETNINYEAIAPFELVHIAIINPRRHLIYGGEVETDTKKIGPLSTDTFEALTKNPAVSRYVDTPGDRPLAGILVVQSQPVFISIAPITDNQRKKQSNSFLLFTRAISPALQALISKRTRLPLHFEVISDAPVFANTSTGLPMYSSILESSPSTITAIGTVRDLNSQEILTISMAASRSIYDQGTSARNSIVVLMAAFLVIANGILLLFLNHTVIGRLERFAKKISAITHTQDFSLRVDADGQDEIGHLTSLFNSMLTKIEESTSKLAAATNVAQHANRAKSAFVAHVSHELRTPIHSLTGLLRILLKKEQAPAKRAYIQMARESASTLLATINDILDLSKIESGAIELQNIEFSLRQVIRAAARTVAPRVYEKPLVQFRVDVTPGVPDRVIGDPLRLQQILVNLLGNAAKFTNEGTMTLQVSPTQSIEDQGTLTFRITDTGIGMTPGQTSRIFKPFVQADETIQHRFQGTGLGLFIVKQLSEQLGGHVEVVSTLNVGTTFTVTLPFTTKDKEQSVQGSALIRRGVVIDNATESRKWWGDRLSSFGGHIVSVDPGDTGTLNHVLVSAPLPDFVFMTHRAAQNPITIASVGALLEKSACPLYVSVPTSDIALYQDLHAHGRVTVIDDPTSPEDILLMTSGSYNQERNPHREEIISLTPINTGVRVLIADDAPTSRLILADMLQEAGYTVEVVENGEQVVQRIQRDLDGTSEAPISILLTDIEMPVMSGFEAAHKIRAMESSREIPSSLPIVAITAHALTEEQERIMRSGINKVVTKPVLPEELERAIATLILATKSAFSPDTSNSQTCSQLQALTHALWSEVVSTRPLADTKKDLAYSSFLDVEDIFHRSGESMRRTKLILSAFLESYQGPIEKLKNSAKEVPPHELIIPTHSIRGLLLDVGAKEAARLATTMENALKAGDLQTALDLRDNLTHYTDAVAHLIERLLHDFPVIEAP